MTTAKKTQGNMQMNCFRIASASILAATFVVPFAQADPPWRKVCTLAAESSHLIEARIVAAEDACGEQICGSANYSASVDRVIAIGGMEGEPSTISATLRFTSSAPINTGRKYLIFLRPIRPEEKWITTDTPAGLGSYPVGEGVEWFVSMDGAFSVSGSRAFRVSPAWCPPETPQCLRGEFSNGGAVRSADVQYVDFWPELVSCGVVDQASVP